MANFSKGYLGGNMEEKPQPKQEGEEPGGDEGSEGVDGQIESHLKKMHAATGHGHSHIQHKPEGHIAHHINHEGQMSGPEDHGDCPGGMCGGEQGGM
jgi:hypothetical protein